jgi:3-methyladenine DNA glycosylase Tag
MRDFAEIEQLAVARKGDLEGRLFVPLAPEALAAEPLSIWLEAMAKALFQAGFNWKVIDAKWSGFQEAFEGFDPAKLSFWHDAHLDLLLKDPRVVRNGAKLAAVLENARFLSELQRETGDAARHLACWPIGEHQDLLALFSERGARLGGVTGQRVCRMVGRDSYVLSGDVCKRLMLEGVIDKPPTSRSAMARVQAAFMHWHHQSHRPLSQISQILALSVD